MANFFFYKSFFVLVLFLLQSNEYLYSQSSKRDLYLTKVDNYTIRIDDGILLGSPTSIIIKENIIYWGERNKAFLFNKKGQLTKSVEFEGRGPGEILEGLHYKVTDNGKIVIYDYKQFKISIFNSSFDFIKDFLINEVRTKQFVTLNDSSFFTFNDLIFQRAEAAITKFNDRGDKLAEWGKTPEYALLQDVRNGGGITHDNKGNIYYSYLGGHKIWKLNTYTGQIDIFDNKPDYFVEVDQDKISSLGTNLREIIGYSFQISRVSGLFFIEPNYVIQQIDTGNPWDGEETHTYLEVWDTKGNKLASKLEIPHWITDVDGENIYVFGDTTTNLLSTLDEKGEATIFDIYNLVRK